MKPEMDQNLKQEIEEKLGSYLKEKLESELKLPGRTEKAPSIKNLTKESKKKYDELSSNDKELLESILKQNTEFLPILFVNDL